jgi:hypothetical protein
MHSLALLAEDFRAPGFATADIVIPHAPYARRKKWRACRPNSNYLAPKEANTASDAKAAKEVYIGIARWPLNDPSKIHLLPASCGPVIEEEAL